MIFISISEIVRSIGSVSEGATAVVSMADSAYHVKIHGIELGVRDLDDPDTSQPNPLEIRYTQEFEIVVHKTVGQKPITQCTIPDGLWNIIIKFNVLKGTDGGLSETLKRISRKWSSALNPMCCATTARLASGDVRREDRGRVRMCFCSRSAFVGCLGLRVLLLPGSSYSV